MSVNVKKKKRKIVKMGFIKDKYIPEPSEIVA